jgi:SAM-dependent methyltransferase
MIISWYRQNARDFGVLRATWLLWRVAWGRAYVSASNALLSKQLECPCCGWQGSRFFDYAEMGYTVRNASCPQCDSHSRHRAFFLWLKDQYKIDRRTGTALIFAPERALAPIWQTAAELRTFRIDIEPSRRVDVIGDIMYVPFASDCADLVWCHHVLEQVLDDRVALRELRRVLRPGTGDLIVSSSESGHAETLEFGHSDKAFSGNRRSYGSDFVERLSDAGFSVALLSVHLGENERRKYAVHEERFYLCRKE